MAVMMTIWICAEPQSIDIKEAVADGFLVGSIISQCADMNTTMSGNEW